ncbi:MAG: energy transducer TonB [Verrucomicrobia bacterium]|jgi:TonB family protein|nr:energy transducer TonB [Verrucomicrobiota bacterium]
MTSVGSYVHTWSRARWTTAVGLTLAIQVGLLLVFSQRGPMQRDRGLNTRLILPQAVVEEWRALNDPTLLALGSAQGFSALWLQPPRLPPLKADWDQPPSWLNLDPDRLAARFLEFARSNASSTPGLTFKVPLQMVPDPGVYEQAPLLTASNLRVTGDLDGRELLRQPELPSWKAVDLLPPSEVRVVVDTRGWVTSAILVSSSGSTEADRFALNAAREVRFAPRRAAATTPALTLGRLVFEWHATPEQTNTPALKPR